MKKLLLLAISVASIGASVAQKIDLDRVYIAHQYRDLPSTPLDSTWRTYNVRVEVPSTISGAMSSSSIEDRINLQGWKKVYGGGHVQLTVNFDDLMFDGQKIENRKEEVKNKEGVVTATNYYYWSVVKYSIGGTYSSSLTDNQIVSLIISMVLCFFWYGVLSLLGDIKALDLIGKSLEWFSLDFHYQSISRGVLDTRDFIYFLGFIATFLGGTKLVFESRKW